MVFNHIVFIGFSIDCKVYAKNYFLLVFFMALGRFMRLSILADWISLENYSTVNLVFMHIINPINDFLFDD